MLPLLLLVGATTTLAFLLLRSSGERIVTYNGSRKPQASKWSPLEQLLCFSRIANHLLQYQLYRKLRGWLCASFTACVGFYSRIIFTLK